MKIIDPVIVAALVVLAPAFTQLQHTALLAAACVAGIALGGSDQVSL